VSYTDINAGKRPVDRSHPNFIPTERIESDLRSRFPGLEFPYVKQDHVAGVQSNVHAWCDKHQMFSRMLLSTARSTNGTKYGCVACANEHKGGVGGWSSVKHYAPGYVGRAGVQSGIFRALKSEYPDTVWEHRMDNGKEIDVYIPSLNFGIEYNGNYYHSSAVGKDDRYHIDKTMGAIKEDKLILHVFTDEVPTDYARYIKYVQDCKDLIEINHKLALDPKLVSRLRAVPCKARQIPLPVGLAFVKQHSLTYMSDSVLNTMMTYIGLSVGQNLSGVLYGVPGKILGVALSDVSVDIRPGLEKYAQMHNTLEYLAPLRCPVQVGLQTLYMRLLSLSRRVQYQYVSPTAYGLRPDNTIQPTRDGCPHLIYDCGWAAIRLK
jgi:hypothetical protein